MKIVPNTIYILILFLSASKCLAQGDQGGPPPPTGQTPPGFPIDNGLLVLMVIGILFSFYRFKTYIKNKKTPI